MLAYMSSIPKKQKDCELKQITRGRPTIISTQSSRISMSSNSPRNEILTSRCSRIESSILFYSWAVKLIPSNICSTRNLMKLTGSRAIGFLKQTPSRTITFSQRGIKLSTNLVNVWSLLKANTRKSASNQISLKSKFKQAT